MEKIKNTQTLDREWVELMLQAKLIGLTIEEVRHFLGGEGQSDTTK